MASWRKMGRSGVGTRASEKGPPGRSFKGALRRLARITQGHMGTYRHISGYIHIYIYIHIEACRVYRDI